MANPLNDKNFLKQLHEYWRRGIYVRLTLLNFKEEPVEYIEGKAQDGSINIDGASSLRRTCNLTIVTANRNIDLYYLSLNSKFKVEIGLKNEINSDYPEIIWFSQGIFICSTFSSSRGPNNYTISISGKDKMALLNGEVGGSLPSTVDFGTLEEISEDGKTITYTKVPLKDIVFNAVETYGNEMPWNIIINDLDDAGYELLTYKGDTPAYIFRKNDEAINTNCSNITFNDEMTIYKKDKTPITLKNFDKDIDCIFDTMSELVVDNSNITLPTQIHLNLNDNSLYTIIKVNYGDVIGYRQTDLIYAGDLVGNIGESVTSVLDKIVQMLGNYEYFYDTKGHFVFQKKKTIGRDQWQPTQIGDGTDIKTNYFENTKTESNIFYNFEDNVLITNFNNSPNLMNARNDFSIWGNKKTISGTEVPIHLRYAIERKPRIYTTYLPERIYDKNIKKVDKNGVETEAIEYFDVKKSYKKEDGYDYPNQWTYKIGPDGSYEKDEANKIITCDWREILYQMAADYHKYKDIEPNFFSYIAHNTVNEDNTLEYPTGRTGYEQYYTDILGFWRDIFTINTITKQEKDVNNDDSTSYGQFFRQVLLTPSLYKKNKYYIKEKLSIENFIDIGTRQWTEEQKDLLSKKILDRFPVYALCSDSKYSEDKIYYELVEEINFDEKNNSHYASIVRKQPNELTFWIDFLDTTGDIGKYSTRMIGHRPKAINDSKITSIYYRKAPNLVFVNQDATVKTVYKEKTGYTYIQSNNALENCFVISSQGKSASEQMEEYLNTLTYCSESVSMTSIPIYFIDVNVRVAAKDSISKMNGEYLISKVTLPLGYNGTMNIQATKLYDVIY